MANGINNKEQNVIEFSPISVYGEQEEDNVLKKLSKQLFDVVNEPKDPYEIGQKFPWSETRAFREGNTIKDDVTGLASFIESIVRSPVDIIGRRTLNSLAKVQRSSLEESVDKSFKESADWMKFWFNSPYTKERLKDMGRTDEEVEEIVRQASNIKGMPFEEISKRNLDDDRDLAWSSDRPPRESLNFPPGKKSVQGFYDRRKHYVYTDPFIYERGGIPYMTPKEELTSTQIHELAHGVFGGDKRLTEKESDILNESEKVLNMPKDEFRKYISDPKGPWRPYSFKHIPGMYGGNWKEANMYGDDGVGMDALYYNDPAEIYSRIFELRKYLDAKPGEVIDIDDIEKIKHYPAVNDLLRYIPIKEVHKLVNTLASNRKIEDKLIDSFSFEDDIFKEPNLA